tara:strand:+ start:1006 stop:1467 length:462 start_codon:yes stop_codon:yes gene_type:complete
MNGSCSCEKCEFEILNKPLIVHGCHCKNCQQQSGSSHSQNAMIEKSNVKLLSGQIEPILVPTGSGQGQTVCRCKDCKIALWSIYNIVGPDFYYIRVGTLEKPELFPPDVHIFLISKVSWFQIPKGVLGFDKMYDRKQIWHQSALNRMHAILDK